MSQQEIRALTQQLRSVLQEKKTGIANLRFPSDCDQRELLRAAARDAEVRHGGNHDTVVDPETGQVITQLPRHDPKPGTCRAIIKDLKAFLQTHRAHEERELVVGTKGTVDGYQQQARRGEIVRTAGKKFIVRDESGAEYSMFIDAIHRIRTRGPMTTHTSFEPDTGYGRA